MVKMMIKGKRVSGMRKKSEYEIMRGKYAERKEQQKSDEFHKKR